MNFTHNKATTTEAMSRRDQSKEARYARAYGGKAYIASDMGANIGREGSRANISEGPLILPDVAYVSGVTPGFNDGYCTDFSCNRVQAFREACGPTLAGLIEALGIDTLAVIGYSGIAGVYALADYIPSTCKILRVRKKEEYSHGSTLECETNHTVRRVAILDDFTSSGETVRNVVRTVRYYLERRSSGYGKDSVVFRAVFLYKKRFEVEYGHDSITVETEHDRFETADTLRLYGLRS